MNLVFCFELRIMYLLTFEYRKESSSTTKIDFFSTLTNWFEKLIISVDSSGIGDANYTGSFVKYCGEHAENCSSYCELYSR